MTEITQLHFLIHGFCYAEMAAGKAEPDPKHRPFLEREMQCATRWRTRLNGCGPSEALVILTWPHGPTGPAAEFEHYAESRLGPRSFVLNVPDPTSQEFWNITDPEFRSELLAETQSAAAGQGTSWNKEELFTALHSLSCCRVLRRMMLERGMRINESQAKVDAWGASFDGCVMKYSLNMVRLLGLRTTAVIDFDLTVPDAAFLLDAELSRMYILENGLRLFVFTCRTGVAGLFTATSQSLRDRALLAAVEVGNWPVIVVSKQGIRLWPDPQPYHLPEADPGYYEPPQQLVRVAGRRLLVPVSAGYVYRLAKAPAYVFAPRNVSIDDFCDSLLSAQVV